MLHSSTPFYGKKQLRSWCVRRSKQKQTAPSSAEQPEIEWLVPPPWAPSLSPPLSPPTARRRSKVFTCPVYLTEPCPRCAIGPERNACAGVPRLVQQSVPGYHKGMVKLRQRCVHRAKMQGFCEAASWASAAGRQGCPHLRSSAQTSRSPCGGKSRYAQRNSPIPLWPARSFVSPSLLFADTENSVFMYSFSHPHPSSLPGPSVRLRPSLVAQF